VARAKEPDAPNLSFDFEALVPKAPQKPEAAPMPAPVSVVAPAAKPEPRIFTVGSLARHVQGAFDAKFPDSVWVEGEVSGVKSAPSGHVYLTLKDSEVDACLDVVAYRSSVTPKNRALLREGQAVRVRGRFAFYAARGRTQFLVDRVEPTGKGALLLALERLKEKLQAEGLFDPARKRPLPDSPRIIGIVTSRSGAVLHDIHKVAFRRGGARLLLSAALVQGPTAPEDLRRALLRLANVRDVDVIILARGGGSSEDLAAFNDEALVRAVAGCRVPVISAVGHETDVTLCDFAADMRASTPSQAAELVVPDSLALRAALAERRMRLQRALGMRLDRARLDLGRIEKRFGDPRLLLARAQQRLDDLQSRQNLAVRRRVRTLRGAVDVQARALAAAHPRTVLGRYREQLQAQHTRLQRSVERRLAEDKRTFGNRIERLSALSPLAVLSRGYAIATAPNGQALRKAAEVPVGSAVHVRLAEGSLVAEVRGVLPVPKS
jgi:exodeoxyribonuclease VII large subunit